MYRTGNLDNVLEKEVVTTAAKHESASIWNIIKDKLDAIQRAAIDENDKPIT